MQTEYTKIDQSFMQPDIFEYGISYFLVLELPRAVTQKLETAMMSVAQAVGDGLYVQPAKSLHITVLDFIDPIIDPRPYGFATKFALWQKIGSDCQKAVAAALATVRPFDIAFNTLTATDSAIILTGEDNGQLQQIRTAIMQQIDALRLPGSKQPPRIIHSTLARYQKVIDLELVRQVVAEQQIACTMRVELLFMRHQIKANCVEYANIQEYRLAQSRSI